MNSKSTLPLAVQAVISFRQVQSFPTAQVQCLETAFAQFRDLWLSAATWLVFPYPADSPWCDVQQMVGFLGRLESTSLHLSNPTSILGLRDLGVCLSLAGRVQYFERQYHNSADSRPPEVLLYTREDLYQRLVELLSSVLPTNPADIGRAVQLPWLSEVAALPPPPILESTVAPVMPASIVQPQLPAPAMTIKRKRGRPPGSKSSKYTPVHLGKNTTVYFLLHRGKPIPMITDIVDWLQKNRSNRDYFPDCNEVAWYAKMGDGKAQVDVWRCYAAGAFRNLRRGTRKIYRDWTYDHFRAQEYYAELPKQETDDVKASGSLLPSAPSLTTQQIRDMTKQHLDKPKPTQTLLPGLSHNPPNNP